MKVNISFNSTAKAKAFAQRVRKVPGVTYATDYCRCAGCYIVSVWGEFDEEIERKLKSKKI